MPAQPNQESDRSSILERLCDPGLYGYEVEEFRWIETHISRVLLTGTYAYKFKKPVDYGFVDFSTLEKRRHFCHREVELNQRLAPDLYRGVEKVTGTPENPRWNGSGPVLEYAVKMDEFEQSELLARRVDRGEVSANEIETVAGVVAEFHQDQPPMDTAEPHATPETVRETIDDSLDTLRQYPDVVPVSSVESIETWTQDRFDVLEPILERRRSDGYIRECHGDLHLENIVRHRGSIEVFDCIEFNDSFRWIDVFSEVAFLCMDLKSRGRADLAHRFLNRYLSQTGFYEDLELIPYYEVYRALVRGKVNVLRSGEEDADDSGDSPGAEEYLHLARRLTRRDDPFLVLTHGFSGTGKTTLSGKLVARSGAIRVRSDVERKRLRGLDPDESSESGLGTGLYSQEMTRRTYDRLRELAVEILQAEYPVVVDATFLDRDRREAFRRLADQRDVPFRILHCEVPEEKLRQRLRRRSRQETTVSEAGTSVLDHQLENHDPLTDWEREQTTRVRTDDESVERGLDRLMESLSPGGRTRG